jgi:hypothetical protein
MALVVYFRPVGNGKNVRIVSDLLPSKVSKWFGECGGCDSIVIEKPPGRLCDGEGIFDIGGHGDTSGGAACLLHMVERSSGEIETRNITPPGKGKKE